MPEDRSITLYADYVCPFCYLGRASLDQYLDGLESPPSIDWHPFDLRARKRGPDGQIDHSVDDGKDEAYFDQVRDNVQRLKDQYDADEMLGIDAVPDVDSLDAQVASAYVQSEHPDRWVAFDGGIYEALWVDGRDIGDLDVLTDVAASTGIPANPLRQAVADEKLRERVRQQFQRAHERGVTGVPTFVYGEHAARGAVPPSQLERLVEGV